MTSIVFSGSEKSVLATCILDCAYPSLPPHCSPVQADTERRPQSPSAKRTPGRHSSSIARDISALEREQSCLMRKKVEHLEELMRLLTVSDWSDNLHIHSPPIEDSNEMAVADSAQSIQRSLADSTPRHHTQLLMREDSIGTVACLKNALSAPRHHKQRLTREDTIGTVACLKNALSGP